jgi:hypothetical protein
VATVSPSNVASWFLAGCAPDGPKQAFLDQGGTDIMVEVVKWLGIVQTLMTAFWARQLTHTLEYCNIEWRPEAAKKSTKETIKDASAKLARLEAYHEEKSGTTEMSGLASATEPSMQQNPGAD